MEINSMAGVDPPTFYSTAGVDPPSYDLWDYEYDDYCDYYHDYDDLMTTTIIMIVMDFAMNF